MGITPFKRCLARRSRVVNDLEGQKVEAGIRASGSEAVSVHLDVTGIAEKLIADARLVGRMRARRRPTPSDPVYGQPA
jgi:hypothetical protein